MASGKANWSSPLTVKWSAEDCQNYDCHETCELLLCECVGGEISSMFLFVCLDWDHSSVIWEQLVQQQPQKLSSYKDPRIVVGSEEGQGCGQVIPPNDTLVTRASCHLPAQCLHCLCPELISFWCGWEIPALLSLILGHNRLWKRFSQNWLKCFDVRFYVVISLKWCK